MHTLDRGSRERGQSEVLGFVLVLGLVITAVGVVVVLGGNLITDVQDGVDADRAETSLAQFDSQAALVALGSSDVQQVTLPAIDRSGYKIAGDAGWINISYTNETTNDVTTIHNTTLGAVVYEGAGETEIAYQGGGVWRKGVGDGSVMISPPEFHYRAATLTLPLVTVRGNDVVDGRTTITRANTSRLFPNVTKNSDYTNPLADGLVTVTVQSEYYQAWGRYFEQRTDGTVTYDHSNKIAKIELVVPFEENFNNLVVATQVGGIDYKANGSKKGNHNSEVPEPNSEGNNYPDVDERINDTIQDCETNAIACTVNSTSDDLDIKDDGIYYLDGDFKKGITVDNPGGNVTIALNGSYTVNGVSIENLNSDHHVDIYVRNDLDVQDGENGGDNASELRILVHSDGTVDLNGNYNFTGLLYAPESTCDMNGGGTNYNIKGAVICDTVVVNGMPNSFEYDSSVRGINLNLNPASLTPITYLHVSDNEIEVDS